MKIFLLLLCLRAIAAKLDAIAFRLCVPCVGVNSSIHMCTVTNHLLYGLAGHRIDNNIKQYSIIAHGWENGAHTHLFSDPMMFYRTDCLCVFVCFVCVS